MGAILTNEFSPKETGYRYDKAQSFIQNSSTF